MTDPRGSKKCSVPMILWITHHFKDSGAIKCPMALVNKEGSAFSPVTKPVLSTGRNTDPLYFFYDLYDPVLKAVIFT